MSLEIEVTYAVQYQKADDPTWYEFTGRVFDNPSGAYHNETADLAEAQDVATGLLDGAITISPNPLLHDPLTATQVVQRIAMGGPIITYGQPQESD